MQFPLDLVIGGRAPTLSTPVSPRQAKAIATGTGALHSRFRAMQTQTEQIRRPSMMLALTEAPRVMLELSYLSMTAPLLRQAPRGDGHPVLVLPGFVTSDRSTRLLRLYLDDLGY